MSPRKNSPRTGTLYWLPVLLDEERLDPADTLLLIALADHVNGDDECHVGLDRLAPRARCAYSTAKRRMAALAEQGVVERYRRRREDGNLSVYNYRLRREWFGEEPLTMAQSEPLPGPVQVVPDQGSPGEALTRAHPDGPAEPPRGEPPRGELVLAASAPPSPKKRTQLPERFFVTDEMRAWAAETVPHVDLRTETEQFADHHRAKGSVMKDWPAAWRTWMRNAARFQAQRGGAARGGARPSTVERSWANIVNGPKHGIGR